MQTTWTLVNGNPVSKPGPSGTPGNALAISVANSANGTATARPTATAGLGTGSRAVATGDATGIGGNNFDVANPSADGRVRTARTTVTSPIPKGAMGAVQGQAQVAIGASLPNLKPNTTLTGFASAVGDPLLSDVLATSAGKPNVIGGLAIGTGGDQIDLVALGALYPSLASGLATTFSQTAAFSFDPTQLPFSDLKIGLQDAQSTGAGFDTMEFDVLENGSLVDQQTFTSLGAASAYFDDNVLDLGPITTDPTGLLDLEFDLDVTSHQAGDGFAIDLAVADVVPEPGSLAMLGPAVLFVLSALRRRR